MNLVLPGLDASKTARRHRSLSIVVALSIAGVLIVSVAAAQRTGDRPHWVASWVTSPAAYFEYTAPATQNQALGLSPIRYPLATIQPDLKFPFPNANSTGASNQTIRSIVKPDLWNNTIRIRLSNVFGNQPLTFNAITVALQEYAANLVKESITPVSFNGSKSLTIPPGQEVWSDAINLSWVRNAADPLLQGRNLAISYSIQGNSGNMSYHSAANTTSFITPSGSGNHTADVDGFAYEYTTTSWFFLTAVDGHRKTLNQFIRTSRLFDAVVDFDQATLDPATGNMRAAYLPNSQFTQLPWDYLHPNHAGYNAMGAAIDLALFAPPHR